MHSTIRASGYLTLTSQFAHHPACCLVDVVDTVRLRQARRRSTPCLIMAGRCNSARTYRFRRTLPLSSSPGYQDFWCPVFFESLEATPSRSSVPQGRLILAQDGSPGVGFEGDLVPKRRLEIGRDEILENLQPSLRDLIMSHDLPRTGVLG